MFDLVLPLDGKTSKEKWNSNQTNQTSQRNETDWMNEMELFNLVNNVPVALPDCPLPTGDVVGLLQENKSDKVIVEGEGGNNENF